MTTDSSLSFTRTQSDTSGYTTLAEVPADILQEWLVAVLQTKTAVTFSVTKDGQKLSLTLLSNGKQNKGYFEDSDELTAQMESHLEMLVPKVTKIK